MSKLNKTTPKCYRCVDIGIYVKNEKAKNGKQRYKCKSCGSSFIENYSYQALNKSTNQKIVNLLKESVGIRGTSRLLKISPTTVISRMKYISCITKPPVLSMGKEYEVDEMCTFIGNKSKIRYIAYALRRDTKEVVGFAIGTRTKKHLSKVTDTLQLSHAKKIYTDRLKEYRIIIDDSVHSTKLYGTNHIERKNTTIRCHLKRLNRKTLAYTKSMSMLIATLTIYFWS